MTAPGRTDTGFGRGTGRRALAVGSSSRELRLRTAAEVSDR